MKRVLSNTFFLISITVFAQNLEIVPLGVYGGIDESNLSSYLIGEQNTNNYLVLDAGTVYYGINKAIEKGTFANTTTENVLKNYIKGYFISHGHLDHISGMIINSPEDSNKAIYGITETINTLKNNYFTNTAWANFGNEGEAPILNKYEYRHVKIGENFPIQSTNLYGTVYELSHVNPMKSSAIMIENNNNAVIYFGDTGADRIEKSDKLYRIWHSIAPKIKSGKLKTIIIEVSFPNSQPEKLLFGHLTPKLMNEEIGKLVNLIGNSNMKNLTIIVSHIKPKNDNEQQIKKELLSDNPFSIHYIFPKQGERILLKD